jgi:hypothetical protein
MAQLTLYIDDNTRSRIERAAKEANVSVSRWVKDRLVKALDSEWPAAYSELFGSLSEDDIRRPTALPETHDHPREALDP